MVAHFSSLVFESFLLEVASVLGRLLSFCSLLFLRERSRSLIVL